MAVSPLGRSPNYDTQKPNHMILWLDASIGDPKKYTQLKKAFGSNIDPCCENPIMLNDKDYDAILAAHNPVTVTFGGALFLLQAFTNAGDCLNAFEENQDKCIFFITSGRLGEIVVPQIIEHYRHIFTDRITNEPCHSIYVFCHSIELNADWAMDYREYIQMFDFDADLLERMTSDISKYFIERGSRLRRDNNLESALQHLHWAKRLWLQHEKIKEIKPTDVFRCVQESEKMKEINGLIAETESMLRQHFDTEHRNSSDDEHYGVEDERPSESNS
ncbi:unnamed protein product [Rotaria sp. Silwood1]|nr:unnamed protein product [Rotaria sp. Silwood1]